MRHRVITIDGPAGSGKSTVARKVAQRLSYTFLDTGALYRAAALAVLESGADIHSAHACEKALENATIEMKGPNVHLNGRDVTQEIRRPAVGDVASAIAVHKGVRERLTEIQRAVAERTPVVAEGRDTGSVVFPYADLKIYLDADITERARRRQEELVSKGMEAGLQDVIDSLGQRDLRDKTRDVSPLRVPDHAHVVDTTHMGIDEVVELIVSLAEERLTGD